MSDVAAGIERLAVVLDDEGKPFPVYVLTDGTRVDTVLYRELPELAQQHPVPHHWAERVADDFRTHSDASAIND